MISSFHKNSSLEIIRFVIFFILYYLYVWLVINPSLIYYGCGIVPFPVFYKGFDFFKDFLLYPGGLIEYVSAFLSQFYYHSFIGSFIITVISIFICLLTGKFITAICNMRFHSILYIPAILLLMIYNKYLNCLTTGLGILVCLFFIWIYLLILKSRTILRLSAFFIFSFIIYYTAGGVYLLFAVLCVIIELLIKRKIFVSIFYFVFTFFMPYFVGSYIFEVDNSDAYLRVLPFHPENYPNSVFEEWILYLFFPFVAIWILNWRKVATLLGLFLEKEKILKSEENVSSPMMNQSDIRKKGKLKFLYESTILFTITVVLIVFSLDGRRKSLLKVNYFYYNEMWDEVLDYANNVSLQKYNLIINHDVNRALYHSGRLLYDMFSYPQKLESLLSLGFSSMDDAFLLADLPLLSETFFRLGLVNNAEHTSHEAMELIGDSPIIIRQLYLINIVKGNTETARLFLNVLSKDLIWEKWAKKQIRNLKEDPLMAKDNLVQQTRSVISTTDYAGAITIEDILQSLLNNKQNRMAFEYLMAYYLLTYQIDKIVQNINYLDNYKYSDIPRHFEEAIVLYTNLKDKNANLYGKSINPENVQKFNKFSDYLNLYRNNMREGLNIIAKEFGDSYYFYFRFGFSGAKK